MKEGYLDAASSVPTENELMKINALSRRKLSADEVYVFSVVLCDNEIDRDYERFSVDALKKLAELYVGKTGIFDHSMKGSDQTARIFECEVTADSSRRTKAGEIYNCLKARAYMPRTKKNEDLILEIDAGIKKEVSVGCSTAVKRCSICARDMKRDACGHLPGRSYTKGGEKQVCHAVLEDPVDAYEWSFVAVPAQPSAGVVKAFGSAQKEGEKVEFENIIKSLSSHRTLSDSEIEALRSCFEQLTAKAEAGEQYIAHLRKKALKLCLIAQPEMRADTVEMMTGHMGIEELKSFTDAYEKAAAKVMPITPQLAAESKTDTKSTDDNYII